MNDATKLVFSRTLKEVTWNNARLVRELDVDEITALKQRPGKNMMIFGSASIVSQLTQHGLIDEYRFVVCPVFLGAGGCSKVRRRACSSSCWRPGSTRRATSHSATHRAPPSRRVRLVLLIHDLSGGRFPRLDLARSEVRPRSASQRRARSGLV